MDTVSQEYINGITDARAFWSELPTSERTLDAKAYLSNIERTMKTFSPGPVKDHLRGERDFWRNQIKIAHNNGVHRQWHAMEAL